MTDLRVAGVTLVADAPHDEADYLADMLGDGLLGIVSWSGMLAANLAMAALLGRAADAAARRESLDRARVEARRAKLWEDYAETIARNALAAGDQLRRELAAANDRAVTAELKLMGERLMTRLQLADLASVRGERDQYRRDFGSMSGRAAELAARVTELETERDRLHQIAVRAQDRLESALRALSAAEDPPAGWGERVIAAIAAELKPAATEPAAGHKP